MTTSTKAIAAAAILGLLILTSCTTSKSLMKDGLKYESAGMYDEAMKAYKSSLSRNMSNVDSRTGLKKSGQRVLDSVLDEFSRAGMMGRPKDAVYSFRAAEDIQKEVKKYGVELHIPNHYYQTYASVEDEYLEGLYETGMAFLENEDFSKAKDQFDEIMFIDPDYRDVKDLQDTSVLEPKYRRAMGLMDQGSFRQAYKEFSQILRQNPGYKDAQEQSQIALKEGEFVMAILPFENQTSTRNVESKVQAYVLNSLTDLGNPFLKIVDRQHLDQIMAEQNFSLSGVINDASAIEVGNLTGAESILVGNVIDLRVEKGNPTRVRRNGYESFQVVSKGEDGKEIRTTKYRPVSYYEHSNANSVYISFHVKVLSLETSEVLISEVIEREIGDEVSYASYSGDLSKLFPQKNDKPYTSRSARNSIRNLLNGRRELTSLNELTNDAYQEVGASIANKVDRFLE